MEGFNNVNSNFIILYGLITRISELIITTQPTNIQQVLILLNEYKVTNMFFIYIIIIMTVSAVLYVIERTAT